MKKIFITCLSALVFALCALCVSACDVGSDITLPIGDGSVPNDSVIVEYHMPDVIKPDSEIEFKISYESDANLDRDFIFTVSEEDPRFDTSYSETTVFKVKGVDLKQQKTVKIKVKFSKLESYFAKKDNESKINFIFREEGVTATLTNCNVSSFNYVYDGENVKISHD